MSWPVTVPMAEEANRSHSRRWVCVKFVLSHGVAFPLQADDAGSRCRVW